MKTGSFTPNPGELFQWHYDSNDEACHIMEHMWSTPMNCFVPLHGINLLVSLTDTDIWWINSMRIINSSVNNTVITIAAGSGHVGINHTRVVDTRRDDRFPDVDASFIHARVDDTIREDFAGKPRSLYLRRKRK